MKIVSCTLIIGLALLMCGAASAQQRELYDTGKIVARSSTDSGGATTIYGADGRVTGRTAIDTSGTTTIYDDRGRRVGSIPAGKAPSRR